MVQDITVENSRETGLACTGVLLLLFHLRTFSFIFVIIIHPMATSETNYTVECPDVESDAESVCMTSREHMEEFLEAGSLVKVTKKLRPEPMAMNPLLETAAKFSIDMIHLVFAYAFEDQNEHEIARALYDKCREIKREAIKVPEQHNHIQGFGIELSAFYDSSSQGLRHAYDSLVFTKVSQMFRDKLSSCVDSETMECVVDDIANHLHLQVIET
jgi:hypothetical protein